MKPTLPSLYGSYLRQDNMATMGLRRRHAKVIEPLSRKMRLTDTMSLFMPVVHKHRLDCDNLRQLHEPKHAVAHGSLQQQQ